MIENYLIQVMDQDPGKFLAEVKQQTEYDQREGPGYTILGSAMHADKQQAIKAALAEAFGS